MTSSHVQRYGIVGYRLAELGLVPLASSFAETRVQEWIWAARNPRSSLKRKRCAVADELMTRDQISRVPSMSLASAHISWTQFRLLFDQHAPTGIIKLNYQKFIIRTTTVHSQETYYPTATRRYSGFVRESRSRDQSYSPKSNIHRSPHQFYK